MWPLIVTSTCFIIPAIKGLRKGKKVIPVVNAMTAVASVNFWRDPKPGTRLKVDKLIAKVNFVTQHFYTHPKFFVLERIIFYAYNNMKSLLIIAILLLVVLVVLIYSRQAKVVKVVQEPAQTYVYTQTNPWYSDFGWRPWDRFRRRHRGRRWWR